MKPHIVLDIDGTLISHSLKCDGDIDDIVCKLVDQVVYVKKRPYMDIFLDFCFNNFESVSIWTAAQKNWLDIVLSVVIDKKHSDRFMFTYFGDSYEINRYYSVNWNLCVRSTIFCAKKLEDIWTCEKWKKKGITEKNLVIVDDTPESYSCNVDNAIPIKRFQYRDSFDNELLKLIQFLKILTKKEDVRKIEKRYWSVN